jgi:outer membrane protein W
MRIGNSIKFLVVCLGLVANIMLFAIPADAQKPEQSFEHGIFHTRVVISGNSYDSDPVDYHAYSGVGLEAAVARKLGKHWACEFSFRTESREIDHKVSGEQADRLGSLELLPLNLNLQYHFLNKEKIHPYFGAGVNLTMAWEKSGVLDSLDVKAHIGPAIQLGLDYDIGKRAVANFNIGWNTLVTDIRLAGSRYTKLKIDPLALSAGVGFRF